MAQLERGRHLWKAERDKRGTSNAEIIESQRREIAEMKYLIRAIKGEGVQPTSKPEPPVEETPGGEAARRAELATTDLAA